MQKPGDHRDDPPDREPLGPEQSEGALNRTTDVYIPGLYRPLLLPQPAEARAPSARQGQQQTDDDPQMHDLLRL